MGEMGTFMTPEAADRAANALIDARVQRRWLTALPDGCVPQTREDAYFIHELLAARLGPVGAFKVHVEATGPRASLVFASTVYTSPARIPAESLHVFGIETEFGFSFGRDLPPRSGGYSENEVLDAVGAVHAAIEIVDSRFADWKGVSEAPKLADNGGNAGIVIGPAYADWRGVDFTRNAVRLLIDGKEAARAAGSRDGIQPLRALAWLASTYAPRFGGIRRGQVIMTGSCTGITLAYPGASIVADFGSLGQASIVFET
jgi:2-keto-4-pentenoate hydratase